MPIIQQNKNGSLKITIPKSVVEDLNLKKGQALKIVEINNICYFVPNSGGKLYKIQEDSSTEVLKIAIPATIAELKSWKKGTYLDLHTNKDQNRIIIVKIN